MPPYAFSGLDAASGLLGPGAQSCPGGHHSGKHTTKRPKHVNLLDRLDCHRDEVLRFANLRVPFTNGSERDIRPLKIKMKVSGGLRSMAGAHAFCRLRSYLSTTAKECQSAFEAMTMLHNGNPWQPAVS